MKITSNRLVLDNDMPVKFKASANHGGPLVEKTFIIMHYTSGPDIQASISWFANPASQVSSHLVIGRDGEIVQILPFDVIGWHAGISSWGQYSKLNAYSLGIELVNGGMLHRAGNRWVSSFGKVYPEDEVMIAPHKIFPKITYAWHKYTDTQLKAAARAAAELMRVYGFREILGHDDIAPKRKWDPGPAFPMDQFRLDVAALVKGESIPAPKSEPAPLPVPDTVPQTNSDSISIVENNSFQYIAPSFEPGVSEEKNWVTAFRPVPILPVPFFSQLNTGIELRRNDSAAASAVMLLNAYFNSPITMEQFYEKFDVPFNVPVSVNRLHDVLGSQGLLTDISAGLTLQDIFDTLAAGKAPIVLLRYKVFEDAGLTENKYDGPFFAVVVGMDVKNIYLHDPLYSDPEAGNAHAYPIDIFMKGWIDVARDTLNPGPERVALIPIASIGSRMARKIMVNQPALNIRSGPGEKFPVIGSAKNGEIFEARRETNGWAEIGDNHWLTLTFTVGA